MKKILSILLVASMALTTFSCDNYLDVNKNEDAPDFIEAHLYLPGILAAYQGVYYDLRAAAPLAQMMGTSGYSSFASHFYSKGSDAAGEIWRVVYWLQGYNLENLIKQSEADEAWHLAGIGYAIKAFSWDMLTKYHGEAPMKQAYVTGLLSHEYDSQEDIMTQVRVWANTAIEYLEKEDHYAYGATLRDGDIMYGGNIQKWIKFAHGVIVNDLVALSNKNDFNQKYAQELLDHAQKAMSSVDETAEIHTIGGAGDAQFNQYNNFWGTWRSNLDYSYFQSDYAVQVFTGTVPLYNKGTAEKVDAVETFSEYHPWELNPVQIICDTLVDRPGHFDPRVVAKLATTTDEDYADVENIDSIKVRKYYGSGFTGSVGPIGTAPNFYGNQHESSTTVEGTGRWLYRDDAPYILMCPAQIKFAVAETQWKLGDKRAAFEAWKEGVALDQEFTARYLVPGSYKEDPKAEAGPDGIKHGIHGGARPGGDKITVEIYKRLAQEYLDGPFVGGLDEDEFSLSHIMMQKWVALYPWGALEAWADMRKYHYDIPYSGDYPSFNNGWNLTSVDFKWDDDPTKVYKGLYLAPAQIEGRQGKYNVENNGSPCYRIRPRYNSEYMWNVPSLEKLQPISGTALDYHCSIPWFAYPDGYPTSK